MGSKVVQTPCTASFDFVNAAASLVFLAPTLIVLGYTYLFRSIIVRVLKAHSPLHGMPHKLLLLLSVGISYEQAFSRMTF